MAVTYKQAIINIIQLPRYKMSNVCINEPTCLVGSSTKNVYTDR